MTDLNKLRDKLFDKFFNADDMRKMPRHEDTWNEAWSAAISALIDASGEFPLEQFANVYQPEKRNDEIHTAIEEGARWQFEQDRARLGRTLLDSYTIEGLKVEKEKLEARLAESELRLKNQEETIAKYQGSGYKELRDKLATAKAALERIISEGIDTSADGGMEFVRKALEEVT